MTTSQRTLAGLMAASALLGGYVHLKLYNDGYQDIPVGNIGRQFLLNAGTAAAIGVALVLSDVVRILPAWIGRLAAAAGVAWGTISLLAFSFARSDRGWFGFHDQPGLNPSPEAAIAVFAEIGTVALGIALLLVGLRHRLRSSPRPV
jgi:hypothetical protein